VNQHVEDEIAERLLEKLVECQRLALLGRLASNLTHDINNQLTGVTGYAQLLLSQERAQALAKELEKINLSANECKKLIINFKRLARFGKQEKEFSSLNIVLQQTVDLLRRQLLKRNIEVVEKYSADLPVIEIDTVALEQAFLNVILNSFDALEKKGGRLSITTEKGDNQLVATFEDDGPGFSQDAFLHLYAPFFTTKDHLPCTGLGLAAAKMLMEKNGGRIEIGAMPEKGTRVRISIPLESIQH
jgi:C4-dicarboxylate-specific signal transduction histidine kinase